MTNDFAVIKLNSKQFIVKEGSKLKVDRLAEDAVAEVLLANIEDKLLIGEPNVESVGIKIQIEEEKKDIKIAVRRFKSKSRYRKNKGHRQPISILKVLKIGNGIKSEIIRIVTSDISETPHVASKKPVVKSKEAKSVSVSDLDITDALKEKLISAGYETANDLKSAKKEDLLNIKGLGEKSLEKLLELVN